MRRQRLILFLIATVVLLGGALLLYGQRTGRLTIFGATPTAPAKLTVDSTIDLQKGVAAGDGNAELVNGIVQLKQGSQFSAWQKVSTNTPDFLINLPAGDSRSWPLNTSFDATGKKLYASIFTHLFAYDANAKSWAQQAGDASGTSIFWSDSKHQLVGLQGTGNIQAPTNVSVFNQNGSIAQVLGANTRFTGYGSNEAMYLDPVSGTMVGFRQIDALATGAVSNVPLDTGGVCYTALETGSCVPSYPQVVEWFDGQYNRYDPSPFTGPWPEARVGASAAYDPVKKEILVFGGFTVTPVFDAGKSSQLPLGLGGLGQSGASTFSHYTYTPASFLWAFDTASKTWSQRIGANQPVGRAFSRITYDTDTKKFLMFGGLTNLITTVTPADAFNGTPMRQSQTFAASNDLWSYDPATNVWQLIQIANPPDARFGNGIGYDPANKTLIVYGGQQGATTSAQGGVILPPKLQDTWAASTGGYASSGTCQFDVGSPQVQQLFRFQSIKTKDLPAGTSITVRFAPSVDGVAFGSLSQPFTYNASASAPDSIDLTQILPANTRFVRVLCTMTSNGSATPTFEGFSVDYQAVGTAAPTFSITPQTGQAPLTVTATRTDSLPAVCTLSFGDGTADASIAGVQTLSHTYQTAGTYTATMTCDGQTSTQTVTATSQPTATTTFTTSKSSFTPQESVAFTLQNLGPAAVSMDDAKPFVIKRAADGSRVFDPSAQASFDTLATDQNRSWDWDQKDDAGATVPAGAYTVTVTYTVAGQSQPTTKQAAFTITQAAAPTPTSLTFSVNPTDGLAPLAVTGSYAGTLDNLIWDFGDGSTQTASHGPSQVQHTYTSAGTYTVSLRSGAAAGSQAVLVSSGTSSNQHATPILVNGSIAGTTTASSGVTTKPRTLVSTGQNPLVVGLLAAWLVASAMILSYRPRHAE